MDENMFDMGSIRLSHVLFESEPDRYLSETLSAKVEPVLSDDGPVLAATFAWSRSFAVFSLLFWLDLCHGSQLAIVVP
jgi:hypothetical protein